MTVLNIYSLALALLLVWQTPQRPAFRSEVNYAELDVSVVDKSGARVRGLTKDDFEVLENGKPQVVGSLTEVNLSMPVARMAGGAARTADPSVASNAGVSEGRVYVIVMDQLHLSAERSPKVSAQITQFVDDFMAPGDVASVITLAASAHATPFTSNKARLRAAIKQQGQWTGSAAEQAADAAPVDSGGKADGEWADTVAALTEMEASKMATDTIDELNALARIESYLKGLEGRRKSLVFVSQGFESEPSGKREADPLKRDVIANALQHLIERLTAANITVYAIDPRGLEAYSPYDGGGSAVPLSDKYGPDYLAPMRSLRAVSEDTGGFATIGFNNIADRFRLIVEDSSSYYVLGYESNQKLDGGFHSIRVRIRGRDVEARTRPRIEAVNPAAARSAADSMVNAWRGTDIKSLLARPMAAGDLGLSMRASASAISSTATATTVQLALEVDGAGFTFNPAAGVFADDIEVGWQAFDNAQVMKASRSEKVTLRLKPETRDAVKTRGWRYVAELSVPPGPYQLRIAAAELNGQRAGSVFVDVPGTDTKADLTITGLAVTSQAARMVPTAGATPTVRVVSAAPMTAARSFTTSDTLTLLAGIVDTKDGDRPVTGSAILRSVDGKTAIEIPLTATTKELRGDGAPRVFSVPLKTVAPGDYDVVVRAIDGTKTASRIMGITVLK